MEVIHTSKNQKQTEIRCVKTCADIVSATASISCLDVVMNRKQHSEVGRVRFQGQGEDKNRQIEESDKGVEREARRRDND